MKTVLLLRRALRSLDETLEGDGLGASERLLLVRLLQEGDALPSELATDLSLSRGRLSHILRRLEKKNLVSVEDLERDRRSKKISLSPDGRPLAQAAEAALRQIELQIEQDLGPAEKMLLQQMLLRIASGA